MLFKEGLTWLPLPVSACCIEFGVSVARTVEIVFGISFSSIVTVCDDTSMIWKGPCVIDISCLSLRHLTVISSCYQGWPVHIYEL